MPGESVLILEVTREGGMLKMSISSRREIVATLRHYSQHRVDFSEVGRLCQDITLFLNKSSISSPGVLNSLQKTGYALWDCLFTRPVKEKLKGGTDSSLLIEMDEELIFIPWELLYDGSNFLALNFNIGRLVKTKSSLPFLSYRSLGHVFKMLILANPTNDLKGAYLEGVSIKNQFDRRRKNIRIDFKSTDIDRLYIKKNICDYDIVHFAGHCEHNCHSPKESGWVLKDGNFSIQDILKLGSGLSLPALIFSNACHSAQQLIKEEELESDYQKKNYSLASAFLFSGVRHYIGAIKKIEDKASLSFAKEFYHNLLLGKSLGLSLRLARIRLVNDYGLSSLHWTNYLLYGDPEFTMFKPKVIRVKRKLRLPGKIIFRSLSVLALIFLIISLCLFLPTINPSAYILFLRSQKFLAKGANREALLTAERAVAKDKDLLAVYPILADASHRIGGKDKAIKYYFDYIIASQRNKDDKHLASAYISLGWFYHLDGEYQRAKDFYEKGINLSRKTNDRLNQAIALRKLAVWNIDKQNYDLALELLTKSSEINRQRQHLEAHRYNLACDYFDIGLVFSEKNDLASAEEFYRKSRMLFEKFSLKNELSDCYFNLGELYSFEKQYEKALNYYLEGLRIDQSQGNKLSLTSDYNMIGELYLEMDNFVDAENSFKLALEIAEEIRSRPDIAAASYSLGILYKRLSRNSKSREFLRKAQEIYGIIDPLAYEEVKKEILSLP